MDLVDLTTPPASVLAVVAHPDDIDFGFAGSVAALVHAGSTVTYAICTSGEAGIPEDMDRTELSELRQHEQRQAAAAVGVTDVSFLGMPDGHLQPNLELRAAVSRAVRIAKPDLVITQSPLRRFDRIYASHPDHLACGEATISAVYPDARNPHAHPHLLAEGHQPHTVPEVWVVGGPHPDLAVDISTTIDKKVAALRSHTSQVSQIESIDSMMREWASSQSQAAGLQDRAPLVETFRRIATA